MPLDHFARRDLLRVGAGLAITGAVAPAAVAQPRREAKFDSTVHAPEVVGLSRAGLESIRTTIQRHIDDNSWTGAVSAVSVRNKLVWYEAQGLRNVETREPMRRNDIFRLMSATKPMVGVAVLMMIEAGGLALEDEVARFIPSFANPRVAVIPPGATQASQVTYVPAQRNITVKDLLTHTSGLISPLPSTPHIADLSRDTSPHPGDTLTDFVNRIGRTPLDFQPGSRFSYSGAAGFDVLLRLVEITSRQAADVFLRERIFEPLDMRDTGFSVPASKQDRLLPLYERHDNVWRPGHPVTALGEMRFFSGSGGLVSTAHDMMRFEEMLFNRGALNGRRLLREESVQMMSTNQVGQMFEAWTPPYTAGVGFGLGVSVTTDPARSVFGRGQGAFGWNGAYGVDAWVEPQNQICVVLMVQQLAGPAWIDFIHTVRRAVAA